MSYFRLDWGAVRVIWKDGYMNYYKRDRDRSIREQGLTLIEVTAALAILSLIVTSLFTAFSVSRLWIGQSRDETLESAYAAAIMELLRTNSLLLQRQLLHEEPWTAQDDNSADEVFAFTLDGKLISLEAPAGINTFITASCYDDRAYYDGTSAEGSQQLGYGSDARDIFFGNSLIEVAVRVTYSEGGDGCQLCSIISGR